VPDPIVNQNDSLKIKHAKTGLKLYSKKPDEMRNNHTLFYPETEDYSYNREMFISTVQETAKSNEDGMTSTSNEMKINPKVKLNVFLF